MIQGISNLIDPPFLKVFTSSQLLAGTHIFLGTGAIWTAFKGGAFKFAIGLGFFLLLTGSLYFLGPTRTFIIDLFKVNSPVAWLSLLFGAVSLLVALLGNKLASRFSM